METNYSTEKSVQIIVALLKAHNIKKIVASPGSTNMCLVASLQSDPFFEIYSCIDERSAAYMACGLSSEINEPVALTCTEATASRNYCSGLTEAYYRKLPILAITATNNRTLIGQNHAQMIDRSVTAKDIAKKNLYLPFIHREKDIAGWTNLLNDAILELFRHGGGPVHIEYETEYTNDCSVKELPKVNVVKRYTTEDKLPPLPEGRVAVICGSHKPWSQQLTQAIERFCEQNDSVVLADHISNYKGRYCVNPTIVTSQAQYLPECCKIDTAIYIGDISTAYRKNYKIKSTWRVNPDGEIRNLFGNTSAVFEMSELAFFTAYTTDFEDRSSLDYYEMWNNEAKALYPRIPELPFSNLWVAQHSSAGLPEGSSLFLGIENTLRSWNFFEIPNSVSAFSNTGGFGIDGGVSSLVGASFANPNKLYFGIAGDLAFFYDMNVLGNRHVGNNIRLCIINNGIGQQFKNPGHPAHALDSYANHFIAAAGHYGNKSKTLVKNYVESLGFEYLSASNKDEYQDAIGRFLSNEIDKSIVFEIFTDSINETDALKIMTELKIDASNTTKNTIKKVIGEKGIKAVKGILGK